jgi:hypothetical protein
MNRYDGELESELLDLADHNLRDLRTFHGVEIADAVRTVLKQVERPRTNLGSSGPPGRAD